MKQKQQVIVIHGGDAFNSHENYLSFLQSWEIDFEQYRKGSGSWKRSLGDRLGEAFEVIAPDMPNKINAKYAEWKIWFEKFIPFFSDGVILLGHSLGGTFLAKYLAENKVSVEIKGVILVAAQYDEENTDESMGDFRLSGSLRGLQEQGGKIILCHSEDDPVVPFGNLEKYRQELPHAKVLAFHDRQHFNQEEFPELTEEIRALSLKK